jgi:succinate dehydrogenase / fumarate reductase membrane anchor subunit
MRYDNPLWRLYDWLLLTLALLHGMNGLRVVIDDYVHERGARLTLMSVAGTLTLIFFMLGTITLITFQHTGNLGVSCLHH